MCLKFIVNYSIESNNNTNLGVSISGTWRKLLLFGFCGLGRLGTARASSSATGTWGEPKPVDMPYSISWNTLEMKLVAIKREKNLIARPLISSNVLRKLYAGFLHQSLHQKLWETHCKWKLNTLFELLQDFKF